MNREYNFIMLPDMSQTMGTVSYSYWFLEAMRRSVPAASVVVKSLDAISTLDDGSPKWARWGRQLRYSLEAITVCLVNRPRLIFCLGEALSPLCLILKRLFGINYVIIAYDERTWKPKSIMMKKGQESASWVVALSRYTRQMVLDCSPLSPDRVIVLPPPVDGNRFHPTDKRGDLVSKYGLQDHKTLLMVGRLEPAELIGKGYVAVINALAIVIRRIPKVKCLIIGPGEGRSRLRRLSIQYGVQEHIVFLDGMANERLLDYYNLCDLFVLPSVQEGFGIVYLEALACGKPVIGGSARGALDALLDGRLGLLVDPDDVPGLAKAIIRMLGGDVDPHLLDPIYLRETVLAHYGFERFVERVGELLKRCRGGALK